MTRLVDSLRIAAHAVGVREIARDGVESHGLRRESGARDVEDFEGGHSVAPYWPVIAVSNPRKRADRKESVAWKRTAFSANAACSICTSTVLPSSAGASGTRYFRCALDVSLP